MKTILYSFIALAIFALPVTADAASFSVTPTTGSYAPGDVFNVAVFVTPSAGEEITTAKFAGTYPADLLEVVSFTQTTGWMTLAQPGYDLIDNTAGSIIKTGGFPAKVTATKQFGIFTFKAKSTGTAVLSVASDSLLLDATNVDKQQGSTGGSFTVTAPVPTVAPTTTPEPEATTVQAPTTTSAPVDTPVTIGDSEEGDASDEELEKNATSTEDLDQLAAAAGSGSASGDKTLWYYYVLAVLVLLAGVFTWNKWAGGAKQ